MLFLGDRAEELGEGVVESFLPPLPGAGWHRKVTV